MSSHHIVRDEQEPALLVLDPHSIDRIHFDALLEWSPVVICTPESAHTLEAWGTKIDYVLGGRVENLNYELISIEGLSNHLETALNFLHSRHHHSVNVVGNPEQVPVFTLPLSTTFNLVLFEADQKIVRTTCNYRKWLCRGVEIRILPMMPCTVVNSQNTYPLLDNEVLSEERQLTVEEDGLVEIASNLKPFLVSERL